MTTTPEEEWTPRPIRDEPNEMAALILAKISPAAAQRVHFAIHSVASLAYLADLDHLTLPQKDMVGFPGESFYGHLPEVVDLAHARWATGTAITALDLCAAALGIICSDMSKAKYELSLREALTAKNKHGQKIRERPAADRWLRQVDEDDDYQTVLIIRRDLTHSTRARTWASKPGGGFDRLKFKLPELTQTHPFEFELPDGTKAAHEIKLTPEIDAGNLVLLCAQVAMTHVGSFLNMVGDGRLFGITPEQLEKLESGV